MNVAIQPCGNSDAKEHYVDTIANAVPSSKILPQLTPEQQVKFRASCGDYVAVWGVTPGVGGVNRKKWERLQPNDIAILYQDKRLFSQGRISLCLHSRPLAQELWNNNADGATWEYIYFLTDLQEIDIPVEKFNKVMQYKPNAIVQGFNVYSDEKADALLDLLEVFDDASVVASGDAISLLETAQKLASIQAMDTNARHKARAEMGPLRNFLFGGKTNDYCDFCGRSLPVGFLVAAHIKKRASCTDEEKRDPRVVMRACKLGCDELYERGYICISDTGTIKAAPSLEAAAKDLRDAVELLRGRNCTAFDESTKTYFNWHRQHPRRILT